MELSACIVVYNGSEEAVHAAQTILKYTRRHPLTLYLVDNASPDGSGAQLKQAAQNGTLSCAENQRVEVICRETNGGFGTGHNTVLPMLTSDYHFILNPDIQLTVKDGSSMEIESFSAVRTKEFKAVGGFDENYFMYVEDADLTQKMRTTGKAYLVPQYTAIHAWHRAAHRSLKPAFWQTRSLLRYFSKWGFKF